MYLLNKFQLDIAYRQFAVSQFAVDSPFNDWRAQDVAQGFAWRPETVCFSVLYDGLMTIDLYRLNRAEWDYVEFREGALRIILIPFTVLTLAGIEIASIMNETGDHHLSLEEGQYGLLFEHGVSDLSINVEKDPVAAHTRNDMWCRLFFISGIAPEAKILKFNGEIPTTLSMDATPA